jgi:hypothetical protein
VRNGGGGDKREKGASCLSMLHAKPSKMSETRNVKLTTEGRIAAECTTEHPATTADERLNARLNERMAERPSAQFLTPQGPRMRENS